MSQMPLFAVNEPVIDVAQHQARRRQRDEDATIEEAIAILERRLRSRRQESVAIKSMADAKSCLRLKLASYEHEVFACLLLDNQHRVIAFEELFRGTIDAASVYPREVVKLALARNAAALIVSHNHPSGVTNASRSDETITRRLNDALRLVGVSLLDHIVVGEGEPFSFAERGLL